MTASIAIKRIQKELQQLTKEPIPGITAKPENPNNLFEWIATIEGPSGSPYENGIFNLKISFPENYPFQIPKIVFTTKVYHCNISPTYICLDILKANAYTPALSIGKVLLSISSLLVDPNPMDPLNSSIANLYKHNRKEHDKNAKQWTQQYAKKEEVDNSTEEITDIEEID